jgi:hypothetical protein
MKYLNCLYMVIEIEHKKQQEQMKPHLGHMQSYKLYVNTKRKTLVLNLRLKLVNCLLLIWLGQKEQLKLETEE